MKILGTVIFVLVLINPAQAATIMCTIDGTGSTPKLVVGKPSDCVVSGKDGNYSFTAKKELKFVLASCWRDGPLGDATACTTGVVRESQDKKKFRVGAYSYPGSGGSNASAAWVSVMFSD